MKKLAFLTSFVVLASSCSYHRASRKIRYDLDNEDSQQVNKFLVRAVIARLKLLSCSIKVRGMNDPASGYSMGFELL